jgi:hypothetical protein
MPYALFDKDTKISKSYPTEDDVWKHARETGLIVDRVADEEKAVPQMILDKNYEIKECQAAPDDNPSKNEKDAERSAKDQPYLKS